MPKPAVTTIDQYIDAAPADARPHLRALRALLREVAPHAQEAIKWNTPFFVEPRFLFGFSAHKAHASFVPVKASFEAFKDQMDPRRVTKGTLQLRYDEPLPEDLIRRMAEHSARTVAAREDDGFW